LNRTLDVVVSGPVSGRMVGWGILPTHPPGTLNTLRKQALVALRIMSIMETEMTVWQKCHTFVF